jgi:hypothetical protein
LRQGLWQPIGDGRWNLDNMIWTLKQRIRRS